MKLNKFLALTAVFATLFAGCGNSTGGGGTSNNGSNTTTEEIQTYEEVDITKFVRLKTLEGHSNGVCSVCWSPDGKYLASGSDDDTVKIWGEKSESRNSESSSSSSGGSSSSSKSSSDDYSVPVNNYSGGGYVPVNTYSGGYENNNTNNNTINNALERSYINTYNTLLKNLEYWINDYNEFKNSSYYDPTSSMHNYRLNQVKFNIKDTKEEIRKLRQEAAKDGINIPMSSLENISVY